MYSMSSLVYSNNKTEEHKVKKNQQKYNKSPCADEAANVTFGPAFAIHFLGEGKGANSPKGNHIRKAISVSSCPPLTLMHSIPTSPLTLHFLSKVGNLEHLIYNAPVTIVK